MKPRPITDLTDVYGMRVLVRTSLDVPIVDGVAKDHFRIERSIQTIAYLISRGARVIVATHIGRKPETSTKPLIEILQRHVPISYVHGVIGETVLGAVAHMKEGSALLLENLRSHEGECANDDGFARTLASYADFYVNDAFAVSHREHASIVSVPKYLPCFAGITFMEEIEALSKAFTPEHASLFILGGAKFETKEPLIEEYVDTYTHSFIGGALANDFIKAQGHEVGASLLCTCVVSKELLAKKSLMLPVDVVASANGLWRETSVADVLSHETIVDIGSRTINMLAPVIMDAKTILWNGPLGNYENGFDAGTKACARLVAASDAFTIVGGGDTIASIESLGLKDSFGFLSTAGGAMLEFLEKKTLPGITALCAK